MAESIAVTGHVIPRFRPVLGDVMAHGHTHHWLLGRRGSTNSSFISIVIVLLMNTWRRELSKRAHPARKARVRRLSHEWLAGLRDMDALFAEYACAVTTLSSMVIFQSRQPSFSPFYAGL